MKIQAETSEVLMVGTGAEHTARIKEDAKAFHILSGALYSDKILAVIRELSCNAYDAQVDAGRPNMQFEVKLPSYFDQTFYVKDFGTGLSEDQIYNLYMVYFESTKQQSDSYIGQLGLGCKSPFSYGNTFTVESRQGGIKKVYTCYKNERLVPAVAKMGEAPTDEVDGLTVSLAVRNEDISRFVNAAKYALMYFKVPPLVKGCDDFNPHSAEVMLEGTDWKIRKNDSVYKGPRVIQGAVSYPVDMKLVYETLNHAGDSDMVNRTKQLDAMGQTNIDLYVPIGNVEVAPSREALTYDVRTARNLVNVLEDTVVELRTSIQTRIDEADTLWDAYLFFDAIHSQGQAFNHTVSKMLEDGILMYQGNVMKKSIEIGPIVDGMSDDLKALRIDWHPTDIQVSIGRANWSGRSYSKRKMNWSSTRLGENGAPLSVRPSKDMIVVIDDITKYRRFNSKVLADHISGRGLTAMLIESRDPEEPVSNQEELETLLDYMGNPEVLMLSEITPAKREATSAYKKKERDQLLVWEGTSTSNRYDDGFSPKMWETQQFDLDDGGVYIELERWTACHDKFGSLTPHKLEQFISMARQLGHIDEDEPVVGIARSKLKAVTKEGPWVNLFDAVKEAIGTDIDALVEQHNSRELRSFAENNPNVLRPITNVWPLIRDKITNVAAHDYFESVHVAATNKFVTNLYQYVTYGYVKGDRLVTSLDLEIQWNAVVDTIPALGFISTPSAVGSELGRTLLIRAINNDL